MKINSDIERIGDLAVNIAERSEVLALVPTLPFRPGRVEDGGGHQAHVRDSPTRS